MYKNKMIWHIKGKPLPFKDLVLADGLNEEGQPAFDICPVGACGIHSPVVSQIKRWARVKDVRKALEDYQKYCCWRPYPEQKPDQRHKYNWYLVCCRTQSAWRKDKIVFDTDTWDGQRFSLTDKNVLFFMPIIPVPNPAPSAKEV